jgi:hypothetical protein
MTTNTDTFEEYLPPVGSLYYDVSSAEYFYVVAVANGGESRRLFGMHYTIRKGMDAVSERHPWNLMSVPRSYTTDEIKAAVDSGKAIPLNQKTVDGVIVVSTMPQAFADKFKESGFIPLLLTVGTRLYLNGECHMVTGEPRNNNVVLSTFALKKSWWNIFSLPSPREEKRTCGVSWVLANMTLAP